jgi:hypothetical protein
MSKSSIPQKRPVRTNALPPDYDPGRRLIAGYVVQAVLDYLYPPKSLTPSERQSALEFVHSPEGHELIAEFLPAPPERIKRVLSGRPS